MTKSTKSTIPLPKRPFRDSAIFYAILSVAFVVVCVITGRSLWIALPVALGCFLIATAYSWWRFRQRLEAEAKTEAKAEADGQGS